MQSTRKIRFLLPFRMGGLLSFAAMLAVLTMMSGCSKNKQGYTVQPQFSVNVGKVDPGWPKKMENLSLAEQEMLKMQGRPDLVHVWWLPTGAVVDKMTIRQMDNPNHGGKSLSWIYLAKEEEVVFLDTVNYRIIPLNDQLKMVCMLGDPQEIRRHSDPDGALVEQWQYYNQGRLLTFKNGVMTKDEYISALPHYLTK